MVMKTDLQAWARMGRINMYRQRDIDRMKKDISEAIKDIPIADIWLALKDVDIDPSVALWTVAPGWYHNFLYNR